MLWTIKLLDEVRSWMRVLDPRTREPLTATIDLLKVRGPDGCRPYTSPVRDSIHWNMTELGLDAVGGQSRRARRREVRILFAFDPEFHRILLLAGSSMGADPMWRVNNVPVADQRLDYHFADLGRRDPREDRSWQ